MSTATEKTATAPPNAAEIDIAVSFSAIYVFNFGDRQILSILLQPIKEDLQLSDTALGFLTGSVLRVIFWSPAMALNPSAMGCCL
jgi:hypothetical protein